MGMSLVRGQSWPPTRCYRDEAVSLLPAAGGRAGRRVHPMRRPPRSRGTAPGECGPAAGAGAHPVSARARAAVRPR